MKRRWIISLACMAFLTISLGFTVAFSQKEDKPKVVVILKQLNTDYWKTVKYGAEKAFADFHIDGEVIAPDSEYPPTKQIQLLRQTLKQHPDAIIIAPTQPSAAISVLTEYEKKQNPVLFVDTDAKWKNQTSYIGTDDHTLGKKAGELLASMLQPGDQVALISGMAVSLGTAPRIRGAREALEASGIKIVTEQEGYDESGHVKSVIGTILKDYPDTKGVLATDDVMALAALQVTEKMDFPIPVVGTDGFVKMMKAVEEGKLSATVAQNPYDIGYIGVEQALKAIKGETVVQKIDTGVSVIVKENTKEYVDLMTTVLKDSRSNNSK
ncbi:sugar ABC transporter substrate-binding protein [Ectobacillus funiculus]|uniref:Sugar ABC transporter substrate-binding protein n=1 Tax=Ectobacillus funiculus TaxID=137993 RepID=A0ABV5WIE1_9BACI